MEKDSKHVFIVSSLVRPSSFTPGEARRRRIIFKSPFGGNSRQGRRTVTSASSRLRRSRKDQDVDLFSSENSRQNTKDIELHDVPDEELREKRKQKLDRPVVMQKMYEKSCNRYKVVPVRQYWETPDNHIISLPNYNLGSHGVLALSVPLTLHDSITRIDLSGNDMGASGARALVEALKGNTSITDLNLADNKLQTAGAYALKEFLREHPVLQTISLSGNGLKDEDSLIFGQVMKENQRLKNVDFSHNEFAETAGIQFRHVLTDTDNLETFDISWNHLRRKGAMDLLAGVKKNYGLRTLNVSFNGFATEGAAVMANVLKKNRTLQEVDMRHNRLTDADVMNIASKMDSNDALRVLRLGDNHFTHVGALNLLSVLLNPDNVVAMEVLDLGNTCVSEDFDFIATELMKSRENLKIIYGRVTKKRKIIPKKPVDEKTDDKTSDVKRDSEGEAIGRANTMPNMTTATETEIDDLEFTAVLESTESAIGRIQDKEKANKDRSSENINSNDYKLNIAANNVSQKDKNIIQNDAIRSNDGLKQSKDKDKFDAKNTTDEGLIKDNHDQDSETAKQSTVVDPRNLFVLQRQSFIEKQKPDN